MHAGNSRGPLEDETTHLSSVIASTLLLVASADAAGSLFDAISAGADDVSVKQKLSPELRDRIAVAFVRSVASRLHGNEERRRVGIGHLAVDLEAGAVFLHGQSLELTPHHRKLLLRLARDSGRFVPAVELRECAGIQADRENKNLRNQVWRLRKRLATACCRVEGAARQGYRLVSASESPAAATP